MDRMERAYDLAAVAVRRFLAVRYPERLEVLDTVAKDDIAVYAGAYDSAESVLDRLGVPYCLNPHPTKHRARAVFANCSNERPKGLMSAVGP